MNTHVQFFKNKLTCAVQLAMLSTLALHTHAESNTAEMPEQKLSTIVTQAESAVHQSSEQQKGYSYNTAKTATKLNLSAIETPQNVKVYTREYLDDRQVESYQELLKIIPGVTISRTDERQSTFARGFQMDYYLLDGIPTLVDAFSATDIDLSIFDRVEVVKGANGLMTGAGNPALGMNFIRKHADSKNFTGKIDSSAGSWNSYSTTIDLSNGLNADGSLRGRVVVKRSDEDSFMERYEKTRNVIYGALDYDLTDRTALSLAATYQNLDRQGIRWGGLPAFYTDGTRTNFDRHRTVSSDWTFWNIDTTAVYAGLKHRLWNDANLNLSYSFRRDSEESALLYYGGKEDKQSQLGTGPVSTYLSRGTTDENNVDVFVNVPFQWASKAQEIIVGGSWNQNKKYDDVWGNPTINKTFIDFNQPNTEVVANFNTPNRNDDAKTTQNAVFVATKLHLLDPLKVVAGARLSNWTYRHDTGNLNRDFKNEWTPYIGAVYDIHPQHHWYASYTSIFKPQQHRQIDGSFIDPIQGKNYETGLKSQFFDGRLNTALAIFRIEQSNVAELISGVFVNNRNEQAYRPVDGVVSKGVELEVDGQINDQWSLNFGIANFEAKDAKGEKVNTQSARTTANLFAKYTQDQWKAGLGLDYRSKIYRGAAANLIEQNDVVLLGAMLGYQVDSNIAVQLNLDNLLDDKYYDGIGANSMNFATPRSAVISLKYQF